MDRAIKVEVHSLKSLLKEEDFKEVMKWNKYFTGEDEDVKVIKKAIKKLERPTFNNIAERVKDKFGVVKLRRLLDIYEDIEWIGISTKQEGKGRPTKIYERIKG